MADPQAQQSRGPGVYVRLELGVSWSPRQGPKKHQLTYMSKAFQQGTRLIQTPTGLHALTGIDSVARQQAHHEHRLVHATQQYPPHAGTRSQDHQTQQARQYNYFAYQYPSTTPTYQAQDNAYSNMFSRPILEGGPSAYDLAALQDGRCSRSHSGSSRERGRSAPAPAIDRNSWDAEPEPLGATALPQRTTRPEFWKAVPATPPIPIHPEDTTVSSPLSSNPDASTSLRDVSNSSGQRSQGRSRHVPQEAATRSADDRARGRAVEIESLATALMTVDNGFEDQWWYQGTRWVNIAGELVSPVALREVELQSGNMGWAVAEGGVVPRDSLQIHASSSSAIDIVSPMSEFPSPAPSFVLQRSLTTRSEELHT